LDLPPGIRCNAVRFCSERSIVYPMTAETPETAVRAFERHDAYDDTGAEFAITTTIFESTVRIAAREDRPPTYTVTAFVPTLDAATAEDVGTALGDNWAETLTRRLEAAPKATRAAVELDEFAVDRVGDELRIQYGFAWNDPGHAAEIAKTFAEYVEGTYVEGIVPGYDYQPPVSSLLAEASQSGESGTPL
jgi:hypothetical protein